MRDQLPRKTILIIEDNALSLKLFNDILQARGYSTLQAMDGREAKEIVEQSRPNLILLDIQLPGVSGLDFARVLKEDAELQAIPIIAVTAFAMKGDEERILESGCDAYLAKPLSIEKFLNKVTEFLG